MNKHNGHVLFSLAATCESFQLANGKVDPAQPAGYFDGSDVNMTCDRGYKLIGKSQLICSTAANGWNDELDSGRPAAHRDLPVEPSAGPPLGRPDTSRLHDATNAERPAGRGDADYANSDYAARGARGRHLAAARQVLRPERRPHAARTAGSCPATSLALASSIGCTAMRRRRRRSTTS